MGVVSAGLSQSFDNALPALAAFLNLTPGRLQKQNIDFSKLSNPSFWRDFHGQVVKQSENIANLIGSLSTKQEAPQEFSPEASLKSVIDVYQPQFKAKATELKLDLSGPLPNIQNKSQTFQQMLSLLLEAESELVPSNGSVLIAAKTSAEGIHLTFSASGTGFSSELLGKVFDPFMMQVAYSDAAALKLMAAYFLAYDLGGKISTQRGSGGQVFDIIIPARCQAPGNGPASGGRFITDVLMNDTLWERLLPNG